MEIDTGSIGSYVGLGIAVLVLAVAVFGSLFTVEQSTVVVIERFGKFARLATAGLNFKIPLIESKAGKMSLRVTQLDEMIETKTRDNVFVKIKLSVQYNVIEAKVFEAYYKLRNATQQISAYVYDTVRAEVPKLALDEVFSRKDEIADAVRKHLTEEMAAYGYVIVRALVTEVDPDQKVKDSMNEINAAARLREAAEQKGEGDKILVVKKAEAEAESRRLNGEGIAKQRAAIIHGLKESCEGLATATGQTPADVMSMILTTQYFDMMIQMASTAGAKVIFADSSPGGADAIRDKIAQGILATEEGTRPGNGTAKPASATT